MEGGVNLRRRIGYSRSNPRRAITAFVPPLTLILLGLVVVFLGITTRATRNATVQSNAVFLSNTVRSAESILRSVESSVAAAFERNRDLIRFSERLATVEAYDVTAVNDFLTSLVISHEPVSAAYYWRVGDQLVYRHDTYTQLRDHAFLDVIQDIQEAPGSGFRFAWFTTFYVPEFLEGSGGSRTVGMVVGYPLLQPQKKAYVVVAIPADRLRAWLLLDPEEAVSSLEITDILTAEPVFAVNATESTIWLHEDRDLARGLHYRTGIIPSRGYGLVETFVWASAPLAAILAIAGAAWAIVALMGRNRLLDAIISTVRSAATVTATAAGEDEFHYLQSAVDDLVQRATAVEDTSARNREYRIGYVFANLIERTDSPDRVQKELERLVPEHSETRITSVVVEIDQYFRITQEYGESDLMLLKFALRNSVDEIARASFADAWTRWVASDRLAVLGFQVAGSGETGAADPAGFAETVRTWAQEQLPFSVTVALGRWASSWTDVAASYDEATRVLGLKAVMGLNRILTSTDLDSHASKAVFALYSHVDRLASQLRSGREEWADAFTVILDGVRMANLPKRDIARLVNYMIFILDRDLGHTAKSVRELWRARLQPQFDRLATEFDVLESLAPRLLALLTELADAIRLSLRDDRLAQVVVEMQEHVRANLSDPSLSLDLYGDVHGVHRSQLSRAFKKYAGSNFVDFLISVRMERAKDLLKDSDARIEAVAGDVGYTHPFSFSRAFRQYSGVSPTQFQKSVHRASHARDETGPGTNPA